MAITRVFIDSRVNDQELLISQFASGTEYQVLDVKLDGIEQIVTALSGQSGYDSIQIISHGYPGSITIGSTVLNSSSLDFYAAQLSLIGNALHENGDLLLYGCSVGAGDEGRQFIETLSQMTGVDVAASDDPTGGTAAGGDWVLESQTGSIEAPGLVNESITSFAGLLDTNGISSLTICNGWVITDFGSVDYANSVKIQDDGKIVVEGDSTQQGAFVARYNADGSLDMSFSGDGKVKAWTDWSWSPGSGIALQSDGKIVIAGSGDIVARINADGSYDTSFGSFGVVYGTLCGGTNSVAVLSDGKIIAVGGGGSANDIVVGRCNMDGSIDTTFDGDGIILTDIDGRGDQANSMAIQSDGKIVVAGTSTAAGGYAAANPDFFVVRYNIDGSLDTSFDGDGKITTEIGDVLYPTDSHLNRNDYGKSVALQSDGKIVVAGSSSFVQDGGIAVVRYNIDGSLDTSFSGDGKLITEFGVGSSWRSSVANSVTVQSDGKIVVAGDVNNDIVVARYNPDGSMDTSFSGDGIVITDLGQGESARNVTVQSDGKIVVVGSSSSSDNVDFLVLRYNVDGSLDTSFGAPVTGNISDSVTDSVLSFDAGFSSPVLAPTGQFTIKELTNGWSLRSVTLDVSTLSLDGSHLLVPMSGTDADGVAYSLNPLSNTRLLAEFPAGIVVGQGVIDKAWHVFGVNDSGGYNLSLMTVVTGGSGTDGEDWVIGTSGNDSINAGAGDDLVEWRSGNDTIDAGDGFDMVQLPMEGTNSSRQLDAQGVFHIGTGWNGQLGTPELDAYLMTKLAPDSFQVQRLEADGVTVAETMVLNNAESITFGDQNHQFQINTGGGPHVTGTPWDDQIALDEASFGNLISVWGDSGNDTLVLDMGAGYSKLEVVRQDAAYVLKGTPDGGGAVIDLGQIAGNQSGSELAITLGTNSFSVYEIETLRLVSGSVTFEENTTQYAEVIFSPGSPMNYIQGTLKDDLIDADALGAANGATTTDDDTLWGNKGNDTLFGGLGDDLLYGDEGDDYMDGGAGNDTLLTGGGADGSGNDTMLGGDGNDTLGVAFGNNVLSGGNGDDWVGGGTGNDSLSGDDGNDTCHGGSGNDSLYGGLGNDYLDGGDGNDYLEGGDGNDTVLGGQNGGNDTLYGNDGDDHINGIDGDDFLYGDAGNDTLYGEAGNDVMHGGAGNDLITAGAGDNGNDTLYGEAGNDTLEGGSGNDTAVFSGNFADYVVSYNAPTSTYTVMDKVTGRDGVDVVSGVENFQFADVTKTATASITPVPPSLAPIGFGKVTTDFGGGQDFGFSVATQTDGRILVAGSSLNGGNFDFALARYNADGSSDTSFGGGQGKITTDFGYSSVGLSVAVQSDGKILVAGQGIVGMGSNTNYTFTLARYNSNGTLDTSFDGDGKVTTTFDGSWAGQSVIVQSDGKIVMVGTAEVSATSSNMALVRFYTDGALDTSFDGDGAVITAISASGVGRSVTQLTDGKLLVAGSIFNGSNQDFALACYNANGTLDTSFNSGALVTTDFGGEDQVSDVVLQSDGKILVAGFSLNGTNSNIAIARYNSDGTLDTTFSGDGKILEELGRDDEGYAVTVQADGKIVVSGHSDSNIALLRYNIDGTPDITFSGDGAVTTNIGGATVIGNQIFTGTGVAMQTDGKILVSGQSNGDFGLVRYNSDGTPDTTFGLSANTAPMFSETGAGAVTTDFGMEDVGRCVILQPDGKILVAGLANGMAGFLTSGTSNLPYLMGEFALARYNSNGSLDTTFNGDGVVTTYFGANSNFAMGATLQSDGRILLAGSGYNRTNGTNDFAIARYTSDGTLDTTFSANGKVMTDFSNTNDVGNSIKLQTDGKILVAGSSSNNFALIRFNADGSFDTSFDGDGKLTTDFGGNENAMSVAVQSDGKILVAGSCTLTGSYSDFAVARYNIDGTLDTTFSGDGKFTTDFGGKDTGSSVVVQGDGKILVAGYSKMIIDGTILNTDFALARYNIDGTLDTTFSGDGKLTTDFNGISNGGQIVTIQADGKILVGGEGSINDGKAGLELVRYNVDGTLDTTFGSDGRFTMDFVGCSSITVQPDGKIVLAGSNDGNSDIHLERLNEDGSLDTTFGAINSIYSDPVYTEHGAPVVLDSNLLISDAELALIGNYEGATLTLARHGGSNAYDHFSAQGGGSLGELTEGGDLVVRGIIVGSVTTNSGGTLGVAFNANATQPLVNAVLQQFAYSNSSLSPENSVQIDWYFSDGNSGSQGSGGAMDTAINTTVHIEPFIAPPPVFTNTAPTFAVSDGKVTTDFGKEDIGRSIAIQADGKILVAGLGNGISGVLTAGTASVSVTIGDHAIARYNSDGSLDTTFGIDGKLTTYFGGNNIYATGIAVQADGKILMAGSG